MPPEGQQCNRQKLDPNALLIFPATKTPERYDKHNSRPSAEPRSSEPQLLAMFYPPTCPPCECTDRHWHHPKRTTTKSSAGTRRSHRWQRQSCR